MRCDDERPVICNQGVTSSNLVAAPLFSSPAPIRTIADLVPDLGPFLAPRERLLAMRAHFAGQIALFDHLRHLSVHIRVNVSFLPPLTRFMRL